MEDLNKNSIFHVNTLYFMLGILFVTLGSIVQGREIYSGLLITQYIIVLIPNLIYIKLKGLSLKKTLKLNRISIKQVLYIVGITLFTYPIAVFLNLIVISILGVFGELAINAAPLPSTLPMYIVSLLVIGVSPGICEEVMFRGTIMNAYSNLSKKKAIIYSAILFGIFHLNLQNLVGPVLLGIIFGIIVYKTNSIYSSMIAHTLNNGIAMTIGYFASRAQENMAHMEVAVSEINYEIQMIITILTLAIMALISYFILMKLLKKLPESNNAESKALEQDLSLEEASKAKIIEYIPVLGIVILFLIINIKYLYL